MKEKRRGSFLVLVASGATLLFYLLMVVPQGFASPVHPEKSGGFFSAAVALQMARHPADVEAVLGKGLSGESQKVRKSLLHVNYFDFAFMAGYVSLLASLFVLVGILHRSRGGSLFSSPGFLNLALLLLVPLFLSDAMENLKTFPLLSWTGSNLPDAALVSALRFWSHLKWGLLAAESLLLGIAIAAYGKRSIPFLLLSFLFNTAAVFMVLAIASDEARSLVEAGSLLLVMGWTGMGFYAFRVFSGKFS